MAKKDFSLAEKNFDLLEKWVTYLEKYGLKPESQLCTDDFAGHLANNVNLAVKAVVGIESFALICENLGRKEAAEKYYALAKDYAARLRAETGAGVLPLAYGQKGSYSIKYNMLFDKLFGFPFFPGSLRRGNVVLRIEEQRFRRTPRRARGLYEIRLDFMGRGHDGR